MRDFLSAIYPVREFCSLTGFTLVDSRFKIYFVNFGEVAERFNVHVWRTCDSVRGPRVRISPSPPFLSLMKSMADV